MKLQMTRYLLLLLFGFTTLVCADVELRSPAEQYGGLFTAVQSQQIFPDSKTFVDMTPRSAPATIVEKYSRERKQTGFDLRAFVLANFSATPPPATAYHTDASQDINSHIDSLWPVLTRGPDSTLGGSSLLPLPNKYVVPGGRFVEVYYWDSYFTMLGLEASGRHDLVVSMLDNFAYLIDRFGHIPNGNRTYYLSRSQPPFFAAMVELVAAHDGDDIYTRYLPQLAKEYAYWMEGSEQLANNSAHRRVVRLKDGTLLNRYWDDRATPREESYKQDVDTAKKSGRPAEDIYRNLRAAAESGWDFSSRWFTDSKTLASIQTVKIAPVDLNSLLYQLERTLAKGYRLGMDSQRAEAMERRATARKAAIQRLMWDGKQGVFVDYWWQRGEQNHAVTAAAFYPLFFDIASGAQAKQTAEGAARSLVAAHGLLTTTQNTGEQWDAPNGWAPLQWIAISGLQRHGQGELAKTLAQRWVARNLEVFRSTGKLLEKYDVVGDATAGGGEYPLQDGFGWTNGVLRQLMTLPLVTSTATQK
jgi:alpha,alpha-trehalase